MVRTVIFAQLSLFICFHTEIVMSGGGKREKGRLGVSDEYALIKPTKYNNLNVSSCSNQSKVTVIETAVEEGSPRQYKRVAAIEVLKIAKKVTKHENDAVVSFSGVIGHKYLTAFYNKQKNEVFAERSEYGMPGNNIHTPFTNSYDVFIMLKDLYELQQAIVSN